MNRRNRSWLALQASGIVLAVSFAPVAEAQTIRLTEQVEREIGLRIEVVRKRSIEGFVKCSCCRIDDPNSALRGETHAMVGESRETTTVPVGAVLAEDRNAFVFTSDGDAFTKREVVVGRRDQHYVEILMGLDIGEGVVCNGADKLQAMLGAAASESKQKQ